MSGERLKGNQSTVMLMVMILLIVALVGCVSQVESTARPPSQNADNMTPGSTMVSPAAATPIRSTKKPNPPIPSPTGSATPTLTPTITPTPTMTPQGTATLEQEPTANCPYCPTFTPTPWWVEAPRCDVLPATEYPCIYTVQNDANGTYDEIVQKAYYPHGSAEQSMVLYVMQLNRKPDGTFLGKLELVPGTLLFLPAKSYDTDVPLRDFPFCIENENEPPCWYMRQNGQSYVQISTDVFNAPRHATFIYKHNHNPSEGYIMIPVPPGN